MLEQLDIFTAAPAPVQATPAEPRVKPCTPPCRAAMKAAADRIDAMQRGERIVYHTGRLANDRMTDAAIGGIATAYQNAHGKGLVILSQRRVAAGRYEYIAIRKGR